MQIPDNLFHKKFDTSLIEPQISDESLISFLQSCIQYKKFFAGIAVNLSQVPVAARILKNTDIHIGGPIAYPLGNLPTEIKLVQTEKAIENGATQIDVLMQVESLRTNDFTSAREDAERIVKEAKKRIQTISLIPNTAYLTKEQKLEAAKIIRDLGVVYKTNTGFGLVTTLEEVKLIRDTFGDLPEIMVSGGCRTTEQAIEFFNAGANKIATSTPFEIFEGFSKITQLQ